MYIRSGEEKFGGFMRFIIFSDSHGSLANMREALKRNRTTQLDGIIFLGDGLKSAKELADETGIPLYAVAGNCDFDVDTAKKSTYEKLLEFDGVKVLIMHGHKYMVKLTGDIVNNYAKSLDADLLLYGHTHRRTDIYLPCEGGKKALRIFNPGSIALPQDGVNSFGLLEINGGKIYLSHGEI